jgi:hypothetical protein
MAAAAAMNDAGLWLPGVVGTKEDKIEKWWEVNRKHDPPLTRGATPLVERCMRTHGWSESFAKRTLKGYRQFMELKSVMNDWQETKLAAPLAIHQMWEQHILDNLNYTDDCFLLFGRVIGHDPDATLNERSSLERLKTTKIAFQARYGQDQDPEVWDYGVPDDAMAIDGDEYPPHHQHHQASLTASAPTTPRGRLPVAGVGADHSNVVMQHSMSPARRMSPARGVSPRAQSLVVSSDEENSPGAAEPAGRSSRSRSPSRRTANKSPTSPKSPSGNEPITIFLRDQASGEETYFSLRYRSTLRIVFTVFAERKGLNQDALKYTYNGQNLTGYETPYSLGLEDRARIDVQVVPPRRA